jgi:hypothetical protein
MGDLNALGDCSTSVTGAPAAGNLARFSGPTSVTSGDLTGDVTTAGGLSTTLANTGVAAGAYTCANVTFDAKGRAVAAANGACGGSGSPPVLVQSAGVKGTTNLQTSFTATLPVAPTPGDLLISVMAGYSGGSQLTCPSGLNAAFSSQGAISNQGVLVCARVVQAGDGASYTGAVNSPNGGTSLALFEFNGAAGFQASATAGAPSGTSLSLMGARLNSSAYTLGVAESDSANTYSSISGGTLLFDATGGATNHPAVYFQVPALSPVTIGYSGSSFGNSLIAMINIVD